MREVDARDITFYKILNKMYQDFRPDTDDDVVIAFTNHLRAKYGIYINIRPNLEQGAGQYSVTRVFVEDEARYNWFILTWAQA